MNSKDQIVKEIKQLEERRKIIPKKIFVQKWNEIFEKGKKCKCCGGR